MPGARVRRRPTQGRLAAGVALALAGLACAADPGGDAQRGARLYEARCSGCHSVDADRVGPRHAGVWLRRAGSVPDFAYSPALLASDIVWNAQTLDCWLADPQALVPGQRMNYRVANPTDRSDVIAFLATLGTRSDPLTSAPAAAVRPPLP